MRTLKIGFIMVAGAVVVTSCASSAKDDNKWKTISSSPEPKVSSTRKSGMSTGFTNSLPDGFQSPTDEVGRRMLKEYGAMFVARGGAVPPSVVVFKDDAEVAAFQKGVRSVKETIGGIAIELQEPAMYALKEAVSEAVAAGLSITPRNADAAKRSYEGTVTNWASRVEPGLKHWVAKGRLSPEQAARIEALSAYDQVPEIFKLESQGMYFSTDQSKSIVYSVAPPGTSQHLSMLALDVAEYDNGRVREILARHGWHQTVVSDLPHFTFLGVPSAELAGLGLKKETNSGRTFWVPDI